MLKKEDAANRAKFGRVYPRGIQLRSMHRKSPAARAGLKRSDVILSVEDTQVDNVNTYYLLIAGVEPDVKLRNRVIREVDGVYNRKQRKARQRDRERALAATQSRRRRRSRSPSRGRGGGDGGRRGAVRSRRRRVAGAVSRRTTGGRWRSCRGSTSRSTRVCAWRCGPS